MKKSAVPTSRYQLFCDTFNTKLEVKIHEVDGIEKLLITMREEDSESEVSVSIYQEEVNLFSKILETYKEYIDKRP